MNDYWQQRDYINRLFKSPKHRPLKYSALTFIGIAIAAQIALIIWSEDIPMQAKLIIRGGVGVCAIIFIILVAIITYRVYSDYFRSKYDKSR